MSGLYKALMRERGWGLVELHHYTLRGYIKAGRSLAALFPHG